MTAQTTARPMPVLPLVGSTMVSPGWRRPSRSAASTMATAMRSLTLPPGLRASSLPSTAAAPSGTTRLQAHQGGAADQVEGRRGDVHALASRDSRSVHQMKYRAGAVRAR